MFAELKGAASCPKCRHEYRTAFLLYTCDTHLIPAAGQWRGRRVLAVDTNDDLVTVARQPWNAANQKQADDRMKR